MDMPAVSIPARALTVPQAMWDAEELHALYSVEAVQREAATSLRDQCADGTIDPREWFQHQEYNDFPDALNDELSDWDPEK